MKRTVLSISALVVCCATIPAGAYELVTHGGALTEKAYERSLLTTDPQLLQNLGVDASKANVFGETYYDVSGSNIREREQNNFEKERMPNEGKDFLTVKGWLMRGAIREDDFAYARVGPFTWWVGWNPETDQDPPRAFWRVMYHFFDPLNDTPLRLSAFQRNAFSTFTGDSTNFLAAPSWALGVMNAMQDPNAPQDPRANHYSVFDAREAMYRALTGKKKDGSNDPYAIYKSGRDKYWATTFRALGNIVHLLQDMAQPQHTRNDVHAGQPGFGHKSIYEWYVECRATGSINTVTSNAGVRACDGLNYDGYPIPRFTKYTDFFSTQEGIGGRGLADYSNRGFFTAGTNLGSAEGMQYPSPVHDTNSYEKQVVAVGTLLNEYYAPINKPLSLFKAAVPDTFNGSFSVPSVPLTTEGLWYQPLADFSSPANAETYGYTLTRPNYDAQANLLIPRAVAYSAGLIDYFFRGRVEVEDAGYTESGISLRVKNAIDPAKFPAWAIETLARNGSLTLAYEYKLANPTAPGGLQTFVGSSAAVAMTEASDLKPGDTSQLLYSFTFDKIPKEAKEVKYRLVFRGKLGEEADAIAVGSVEPRSGFVVTPSYTPADGLTGARHIYRAWGEWRLSDKTGLTAGNVDWKGWYTNGKPTKVLSWWGPRARYFRVSGDPAFAPNIYQNGELWAVAPMPVLGAALYKDADQKEWIVATCTAGSTDLVYRRPNTQSSSNALYNPKTAPEGWELIGNFPAQNGRLPALVPWFFNKDGTEAQTIRWALRNIDGTRSKIAYNGGQYTPVPLPTGQMIFLDRLKMTFSGSTAQLTEVDNKPETRSSNVNFNDASQCLENCGPPSDCSDPYAVVRRGKLDRKSEFIATDSGKYVVAVDYDESGELVAEVQVQANQKDSMSESGEIYTLPCLFDTHLPGTVVTRKHQFTSSVKRMLQLHEKEFPLQDHAFDINRAFYDDVVDDANDVVTLKFSAPNVMFSSVRYADLRTNTLILSKEKRNYYLTDEPIYPHIPYEKKVRFDATKEWVLYHGGEEKNIDKSTTAAQHSHWSWSGLHFRFPVNTLDGGQYLTIDYLASYGVPIRPFPVMMDDVYISPPLITEKLFVGNYSLGQYFSAQEFKGSIGVNSDKDVFASVPYQDKTGAEHNFNYLTGGDIGQIVPVAPPEASYQSIRVAR